jgi:hypothetical protein
VPTDVEVTDPKISIFVPVPAATVDGVCEICHNATLTGQLGTYYPRCWNCRSLPVGSVGIVAPISLVHTSESQLYASLRDYKSESPYISEGVRAEHRLLLAATLQRFLRIHRPHIEEAGGVAWDAIQVVPSTRQRHGDHPLEDVIRRTIFRDQLVQVLTPTGEEVGHNQPNPAAFAAREDASTRRFLLVDDTFTTGARVQSAAGALSSAGATVVAAVPIGRVIDTNHPTKEAFWRERRSQTFDFDRCCLEG